MKFAKYLSEKSENFKGLIYRLEKDLKASDIIFFKKSSLGI